MFINYTPKTPRLKVIPLLPTKAGEGYAFDNDSVTLRPGTNELKQEEWEAIQPHIKDLIGKEITPFSVKAVDKKSGKVKQAKTIKDVPIATARKIIQGCQDPKTLKKWFNSELTDELLLVVSKRMRQLKVEPDDIEEEEADLKNDITPEGGTGTETKTDSNPDPDPDPEEEDDIEEEEAEEVEGTEESEDEDEIPDFDGSRSAGN